MYISGFLTPVQDSGKDTYRKISEIFWDVTKDCGAIEYVEAWEDDVPDGKQTDFRRAVQLQEGEKVVFSWVIWPSKAVADAAQQKMMDDPRMKEMDLEMPFDGKRMIWGGFEPFVVKGRD